MDLLKPSEHSALMSRVRPYGNKSTELRLIGIFKKHGITGWRRKQVLIGKPDFMFRNERLCVFVDGCLWHSCPKHATWPKQNEVFWRENILQNRARDREVTRELRVAGWKVLPIWEHSLKK